MDISGVIDYLIGFAIMAMIYAIFTLGLNVHWGFTGLFNIGIAGFFALGAYTAALLTSPPPDPKQFEDFIFGGNLAQHGFLDLGIDLWFFVGIAAAAAVCGIVALIIGTITLRLNDDYLSIATLGIAESVRFFFLNEKWAANGSKGLYRIPKFMGELVAPENYDYLYVVVVLIVLAILFVAVQRAARSPWGRVLRAIREDEVTTAASGKNVFHFKLQSFVFGAMIMGIGGALFAHHVRFLSPLTFDPLLATFVIWAMLMVGGSGNNLGAVLGAFVVWGIWAGTQFLPGIFSDPSFRLFMIGVLIVAIMLWRPGGLLGEWRRIIERRPASATGREPAGPD
ncbi:MAG: branched-chain amino acid ABC transporter permease [Chloroflexota bacterium]|nr:branched-chain amino acid ABC transporter permease [Chloroflexota bacterium]MDE2919319.1 branched-chain amino acid ABC transporter permease [Chloroflexota bacterium]